jgi:carboxyl-terminal processing protease
VKEDQNRVNDSPSNGFFQIKKFTFIMIIFLTVFLTAAVTIVALSFGDDKAANVGIQERKEFQKLYEAYDQIKKAYFENINEEKLINGAIDGMVKSLDDPYSDYMTKKESEMFHDSITSSFEGIGAEIQELNGSIVVVSPIKGSPAEKAGLKPNDKIIEVDGKSVQGMSANEAVLLIRGKKGTKVTLSILRGDSEDPIKMTITRDKIPIHTVYSEMLGDGIAKIQITSFSTHTDQELEKALKELEEKNMKGLILDLRKNPGGLLEQAISISNLFVPEGKLLFQVANKDGKVEKYVAEDGKKVSVPTIILIDEGSASASEILAAAASESAHIPLVGKTSFGKGTVQATKEFQDGSNLKYTMAKWLTPKGNWIHEKGIEPDYPVSMPKYAELPYINPDHKLKEDTASSEVNAAEQILKELGYDPGKVDSYFDSDTAEAVKQFQRENDLEATGVLTGETTVTLMNQIQKHLQKNDPQLKKAEKLLKAGLK